MKVLITGTAGFIGFHLVDYLIQSDSYEIVGLDMVNDYYDINLKYSRLELHGVLREKIEECQLVRSVKYNNYSFIRANLADHDFIVKFMVEQKFDYVIALAAQAGVRHSIEHPRVYTNYNIDGFLSILEGSRYSKVKHLIYASTSSVYGLNSKMPLTESQQTERPLAIYAVTKKANEMMAHSYSNLFKLPTTGLRFFTVYGPWGRPDMALFLFTDAIINDRPIKVFNHGDMVRDFTYVGDVVESIARLLQKPAKPDSGGYSCASDSCISSVPYQVFNIGNSKPVKLIDYIEAAETALGKKAIKTFLPMQQGDVPVTHAETSRLEEYIGFRPQTSIKEGVKRFIEWYKAYYQL